LVRTARRKVWPDEHADCDDRSGPLFLRCILLAPSYASDRTWIELVKRFRVVLPRPAVLTVWPSQPLAARFADGRDGTAAVEPSVTRFVALICILPLFAQSFYYLLPVAPLYYLSKVWPVLMLPAAAWALTRLQLQSRTVYVIWLAYALGLTPLISMMQLGAGFFDALTTTVKVSNAALDCGYALTGRAGT
jgi:hypothetical protein